MESYVSRISRWFGYPVHFSCIFVIICISHLLNGILSFKDLKIAWIFYFFKIFTSIITFYGANFEFNEYFTHVENLTIAGSVVDKKTIAIIVAMVNLNFKILILLLTFEFKIVCKN